MQNITHPATTRNHVLIVSQDYRPQNGQVVAWVDNPDFVFLVKGGRLELMQNPPLNRAYTRQAWLEEVEHNARMAALRGSVELGHDLHEMDVGVIKITGSDVYSMADGIRSWL